MASARATCEARLIFQRFELCFRKRTVIRQMRTAARFRYTRIARNSARFLTSSRCRDRMQRQHFWHNPLGTVPTPQLFGPVAIGSGLV